MYEDKTLICKDCGNEFVFSAGEQEFYAEKGFVNEPQRCKACRQARKQSHQEKCTKLYVQVVVAKQLFHLSQWKARTTTVANVLLKEKNKVLHN